MEERVCKSCCATKDIEEFDGFKGKRSENAIARIRMNTTKPEEKRELKGVNYAKNAVTE